MTSKNNYSIEWSKKRQELIDILREYNPQKQYVLCKDVNVCLLSKAPTLGYLARTYNRLAPVAFLNPQISDIAAFSNCNNILNASVIEDLAMIISNEYSFLKVTELMLFFYRFKLGRYESFYGSVSPIAILKSLKEFIHERRDLLHEIEYKERLKQDEEAKKKAISYQEYLELKKKESLTKKREQQ